jgi:hypothetical protein
MTVERMCQLGGISRSGFYRMGSRSEGVDRHLSIKLCLSKSRLGFKAGFEHEIELM